MGCIFLLCVSSESLLDVRGFTLMKAGDPFIFKDYSWAMFLDISELLRDVYAFDACL